MRFTILRHTAQGHVARSIEPQSRVILVSRGSRVGEEDQLLSIERDIVAKIAAVNREIRPSSPHLQIHGVELESGISSDFLIVNTYSTTRKAILHATAHPELADEKFIRILCPSQSGIKSVFLVSQSAFFKVEMPLAGQTSMVLELTTVLENIGGDFFGSIIDYLREELGEGMPNSVKLIKIRPRS